MNQSSPKDQQVLFLIALTYILFLGVDLNTMAHSALSLTFSLVHEGKIIINDYMLITVDVSGRGSNFYSGVPPGLSFYLIPWYAAVSKLICGLLSADYCAAFSLQRIYVVGNLIKPFSNPLIAVISVFYFQKILNLLAPEKFRIALLFLYGFGSLAFTYSTTISSRMIAVSLSIVVLYYFLVFKEQNTLGQRSAKPFLLGLLSGLTVCFNYASILVAVAVSVWFIWETWTKVPNTRNRLEYLAQFALGALIPAVLLMTYHWAAFGGPFETPYQHRVAEGQAWGHGSGFAGVTYPKPWALLNLLLLPSKGLLFYMPFYFFSLVGLFVAIRKRESIYIVCGALTLVYVLYNSSVRFWPGECCFGPRLLMESMPFAVIALIVVIDKLSDSLWRLLLLWSIFINSVGAFYKFSCISPQFHWQSAIYYICDFLSSPLLLPLFRQLRSHFYPDSFVVVVVLSLFSYATIALLAAAFFRVFNNHEFSKVKCFVNNFVTTEMSSHVTAKHIVVWLAVVAPLAAAVTTYAATVLQQDSVVLNFLLTCLNLCFITWLLGIVICVSVYKWN